jgi:SAM-dependent methyltransferase
MSGFSSVDDAPDPAALVERLDEFASAASGMKHYAMAAHALRRPRGPILDLGCGAGHDLVLLAAAALPVVGVDASIVMLAAARARTGGVVAPLVRAAGERLPFRDASFSGCRIERVLMHVDAPEAVLDEAVRCVTSGGLITVYEPNWAGLRVRSEVLPEPAGWLSSAKHPDIGARLWELLENAGCDVADRVEELSAWRSLATLERVAGFPDAVDRAVNAGRVERAGARRWVREQRQRDARGQFFALMPKIQVIATRR